MQIEQLKNILEAILLTADQPMDMRRLEALFEVDDDRPSSDSMLQALQALQDDYQGRGIELKEVASGYRMQVNTDCAPWVSRMWEEKPPRYSRALLETLVLIAYRQPITRGEIEEIRGVSVSTHIIKTLSEREWVRVLGHKDVPGRPSMYGTTRDFLDYFNLKSLDELPGLADITDLDKLHPELALEQEVAADDGEVINAPDESGEESTEKDEQISDDSQPADQVSDDENAAQAPVDEVALTTESVENEAGEKNTQDASADSPSAPEKI
ncbi:MAG TPA: SMC-Scp complex subunit ScpB [Gammaproteobacteria bacterium]|nr:SMC-Scp complex subunit ScpB [Gammaproteobacteria bacterium]